jgi:DNA-binding NarL/FixJ family response regulator
MTSATNVADEPSPALVRVVVALPHVRLCRAIATALESTGVLAVVAETGDIVSAVESTLALRPGVVVLGISLVVGDVVEGVQVIIRAFDGVPVVLVGHEDGAAYEAAVMAAGAAAYVPLKVDAYAFARVLRCAAAASASQR